MLERDDFPVVRLAAVQDCSAPEVLRLEVAEGRAEVGYTAVSHLWRDGLGNVGCNALPICQVLRLSRLIEDLNTSNDSSQSLPPSQSNSRAAESSLAQMRPDWGRGTATARHQPTYFWIDTLFVPIAKDLKTKALTGIKRVFEDAEKVLALDAALEDSTCHDSSSVENLMRIYCSGWMERLWTFEECVVARDGSLHVQFADGVVPPPRPSKALNSLTSKTGERCTRASSQSSALRLFLATNRPLHNSGLQARDRATDIDLELNESSLNHET